MTTSEALRVHRDGEGRIWLGQFGVCAARSSLAVEEFVRHPVFTSAASVRVQGSASNALLIAQMYERRPKQRKFSIQVVQPVKLAHPRLVLQQLWQPCLGPLREYELTDNDYVAYALAAVMREKGTALSDKAKMLLGFHPALAALAMVGDLDWYLGARVLAEIVDPRWYIHPDRPQRRTRLYRYLGLCPADFLRLAKRIPREDATWRSFAVCYSWCPNRPPDPQAIVDNPQLFLHRIACQCGDLKRGWLRASRKFVDLIALTWLQSLAPAGRRIFEPELFFKSPAEAQFYRDLTQAKKRV